MRVAGLIYILRRRSSFIMSHESEAQIIAEREKHLKALKALKINPYPSQARRTAVLAEIARRFSALRGREITIAGRLTAKREHGALIFGDLKDESGQLQVMFSQDLTGKDFKLLELIDAGDFLELTGKPIKTKKGEKSLAVSGVKVLSKSLRPLPSQWYGLKDLETRFRQRYLDFLINPATKERFIIKHRLVQAIREFLIKDGFIEVDTPALQPLPGGALATPFKTHYKAMDADIYLRIAPELYLKRLIIGGFEKVFEFARVFRNEGVSREHLQDFTILEFYQAYATYEDLMKLTEKMFTEILKKVLGKIKVEFGGKTINFKTPWPKKSFRDLILHYVGIDIDKFPTAEKLAVEIKRRKINLTYKGQAGRGKLVDELYKEKVRPHLLQPIFLTDHPLDLSPLAKKKENDASKVQRFQLVVAGMEIVNAFSELNDPVDQKERFKEQARLKKAGDAEAHLMDEDFIKALEYGMPPTAGWGLGLERLTALLTDAESVREAVLFPFIKDK